MRGAGVDVASTLSACNQKEKVRTDATSYTDISHFCWRLSSPAVAVDVEGFRHVLHVSRSWSKRRNEGKGSKSWRSNWLCVHPHSHTRRSMKKVLRNSLFSLPAQSSTLCFNNTRRWQTLLFLRCLLFLFFFGSVERRKGKRESPIDKCGMKGGEWAGKSTRKLFRHNKNI